MRAAMFYGPEEMRVEEMDAPDPGPGEILVDVAACGICGSDLHFYEGGIYQDDQSVRDPVVLGHEIGGTIAATGEGVDIDVGTDVVLGPHRPCMECWCCEEAKYNLCRDLNGASARPGGYAEKVVEMAENAIPLPEGVSPEDAAIAQPVSVGQNAVRESPLGIGDSAVIIGTGPIGLGALQFAKSAGASPIYVSEPQDARREIAADFGADVLIDPSKEDPIERIRDETVDGVDVAFEAVGHETTLNHAIEATKPDGHAMIIGVFGGTAEIEPRLLVRHQRTVGGSASHQQGPLLEDVYGTVLRQLASGELDADKYVSSRINLDDIVEDGFEALLDEERKERKILVCP